VGIVPVVAWKAAEVWPAGTVSVEGTVTRTLLLAMETMMVAAPDRVRVTVQVVDEPPPSVESAQDRELNCG
jgi:hypothetical protein